MQLRSFQQKKESSQQKRYEVGDDKAVVKCGQALREGTADLIRKAITDGGSAAQVEDNT